MRFNYAPVCAALALFTAGGLYAAPAPTPENGADNSDCIGKDCASNGSVEYADGTSTPRADKRLVFDSFLDDVWATGKNHGKVETNTDPKFIRGGDASIKHSVWLQSKRAELSDLAIEVHPTKDPQDKPYYYWYGWSYFFPEDDKWAAPIDPLVEGDAKLKQYVGQWRFSNLNGCATMANCNGDNVGGSGHHLTYEDGRLVYTMTVRDTSCTTAADRLKTMKFDLGPVVKGAWMDFVIQGRWASDESGTFKAWIQRDNGGYTQAVDYSGQNWFRYNVNPKCRYSGQEAKAPNLQIGMYWSNDRPAETDPRVLYSDQIKMRRSLSPNTIGSDGWNKVLPARGVVNPPALAIRQGGTSAEFEKLKLTPSAGASSAIGHDKKASALRFIKFQAKAPKDSLEGIVHVPESGTYNVGIKGQVGPTLGEAALTINGKSVGNWNQRSDQTEFTRKDFNNVPLNAGANTFKWEAVGDGNKTQTLILDALQIETPQQTAEISP